MHKLLLIFTLLPCFAEDPITRIACGSCYKPEGDNGIWKTIAADKPQAFLFMGDNIYADTSDPGVMQGKYHRLNRQPDYATFAKKVPIFPIWDDHDYGKNDAGREFKMKETSAKLFFNAFHFPSNHEARKTPGVYHSKTIGPEGKRVQIIMLDTRYFRSKLTKVRKKGRMVYVPPSDPDATILGKAQWQWLESQLKNPADLRIIVSSIQILNTDHRFEKWSNMPTERTRFLKLLQKSNPGPTLLLSGDRHLAEVCRLPKKEAQLPFDLFEMTSSGMTHAGAPDDPSPLRVSGTYSRNTNYGLIDIQWIGSRPLVDLIIKTSKGEISSTTKAF